MMKSKIVLLLLLLWVMLGTPLSALAHPLGNFTVNRYSRLELGAKGLQIYYVLDMAEIPTFQLKDTIDQNHNAIIEDAERLVYGDQLAKEIQANLSLTIDNQSIALKLVEKKLTFPIGQGNLETMRLTARFETAALASQNSNLAYQDTNYSDRLGWKEIVVRNRSGLAINQSSAPTTDVSNELRLYPNDMLSNPLNVTSAQVNFKLDPSVIVDEPNSPNNSPVVRASDPLTGLVNIKSATLGTILLTFGAAFILGVFHAFSPGHGKTVVAAYLVGSRGTAKHAVFLGLIVTVTHTIGVFALGLITLFASQFILPEKLYPWLGLLSGLVVLVMGVTLFRSRLNLANATVAVVPLAHSHSDDHTHDHNDGYSHEHEHAASEVHSHGGVAHSHLPPGTDGTPITWKYLLLFGISAGLLPCPSALVVMLSAIALQEVGFGIILTIFFSFGLAGTLTGIGILLVYGRRMLNSVKISQANFILRYLPVASACVITILGLIISYQALIQTGLIG